MSHSKKKAFGSFCMAIRYMIWSVVDFTLISFFFVSWEKYALYTILKTVYTNGYGGRWISKPPTLHNSIVLKQVNLI